MHTRREQNRVRVQSKMQLPSPSMSGERFACNFVIDLLNKALNFDAGQLHCANFITGSVVLVTGGGSGIGRLLSLEFAKRNCKVVIWDINRKGLCSCHVVLYYAFFFIPST